MRVRTLKRAATNDTLTCMSTTYSRSLTTSIDSIPGTHAPITCGSSSIRHTSAMGAATAVAFSNSTDFLRSGEHRLNDTDIPGTAAEIAIQRLPHLGLGWAGMRCKKGNGRHDETRRTVPALQSAVLEERLL